eukprot:11214176-Karenia_brevis.AAC.1
MFISAPPDVVCISPEDLYDTIQDSTAPAPILDSWTYQDWQLLPVAAFTGPAHILNRVEQGHPWPSPALHVKSHPLNK